MASMNDEFVTSIFYTRFVVDCTSTVAWHKGEQLTLQIYLLSTSSHYYLCDYQFTLSPITPNLTMKVANCLHRFAAKCKRFKYLVTYLLQSRSAWRLSTFWCIHVSAHWLVFCCEFATCAIAIQNLPQVWTRLYTVVKIILEVTSQSVPQCPALLLDNQNWSMNLIFVSDRLIAKTLYKNTIEWMIADAGKYNENIIIINENEQSTPRKLRAELKIVILK